MYPDAIPLKPAYPKSPCLFIFMFFFFTVSSELEVSGVEMEGVSTPIRASHLGEHSCVLGLANRTLLATQVLAHGPEGNTSWWSYPSFPENWGWA